MPASEAITECYSLLYTVNALEKLFSKGFFKTPEELEQYATNTDNLLHQWTSISELYSVETPKDMEELKQLFRENENEISCGNELLSHLTDVNSNIGYDVESLKLALKRINAGVNGIVEQQRVQKERKLEEERQQQELSQLEESTTTNETTNINETSNADKKAIAEATSAFITLMDAIKLEYDTKDTLHPLFSDVLLKAGKISTDFAGRPQLVSWLIKLNQMDITDTVDEAERKQMLWDVDSAYNGFFDQL